MFLPQRFRIGHGFLSQGFELVIVGFELLNLLLQLYDSILQCVECRGGVGGVVELVLESLGDFVHDLGDPTQLVRFRLMKYMKVR